MYSCIYFSTWVRNLGYKVSSFIAVARYQDTYFEEFRASALVIGPQLHLLLKMKRYLGNIHGSVLYHLNFRTLLNPAN